MPALQVSSRRCCNFVSVLWKTLDSNKDFGKIPDRRPSDNGHNNKHTINAIGPTQAVAEDAVVVCTMCGLAGLLLLDFETEVGRRSVRSFIASAYRYMI
jgi:hypothetical protein